MFFYRIPEPNEALVISGAKGGADGAQFRIVTGHGTWVAPWKSRARLLSLDLYESKLEENCVTSQGIALTVQAVAVFKVADEEAICSFLLGLGEDVEVLAPPALRARVASELGARIGAGSTSARR